MEKAGWAVCLFALPAAFIVAAALDVAAMMKQDGQKEKQEPPHPAFCPADTPEEEVWAFTQEQDALDEAAIEDAFDKYMAARNNQK